MRISDWSSDVCSSDLAIVHAVVLREIRHHHRRLGKRFPLRGPAEPLILGCLISGIFDAAKDSDTAFLVETDGASLTARMLASRSEEHTSELQSLMRISYAVFCLKKKKQKCTNKHITDLITSIIYTQAVNILLCSYNIKLQLCVLY